MKYMFRLFKCKRNIFYFCQDFWLEERKEERIPGGRLARVDTSIASGEVFKG